MPSVAPTTRSGFVIATPAIADAPSRASFRTGRAATFIPPPAQAAFHPASDANQGLRAIAKRRARNLYAATVHHFPAAGQPRKVGPIAPTAPGALQLLIEAIKSRFRSIRRAFAWPPILYLVPPKRRW